MPFLTEKQIEARRCLAVGSFLIDPKYLYPQDVAEARFKERVKENWHLREYFPAWVGAYIAKWAAEKTNAT